MMLWYLFRTYFIILLQIYYVFANYTATKIKKRVKNALLCAEMPNFAP